MENNTRAQLDYVKQQSQVIAEIHDLLMLGKFPGAAAQKLVMGQAYMKGLHEHMQKEVKKVEEILANEMAPTFTEALTEQIKA